MSPPPASTIGTVISRGTESANEMAQADGPSVFDVWSHSYDGMSERMRDAARDPAAFLATDPAQQARIAEAMMPGNWSRSSFFDQVTSSIAAQASTLGGQVDAIGNAEGALQTVGATFALLISAEQILSSALSAIPFPAFPAIRVTDMDICLPHAHGHPPNLIGPGPPIPLPSTGPVIPIPILSGATQTLINGMPAARCGDMGLGIWCGGYFPMYETFLGSSSVWIEGARAARVAVDITKHCIFTTPKPQDPPLGPMIGVTMSSSSNVMIGGVPMPSLTAIAIGAAMRGLFRLLGKGASAFSRLTAPLRERLAAHLDDGFLKCNILRAEPVNFITGEVFVDQQDYAIPGPIPFEWDRHYGSKSKRMGICGYGWSTPADTRLVFEPDGVVLFMDGSGAAKIFPQLPSLHPIEDFVDGARLTTDPEGYCVELKSGLSYLFPKPRAGEQEVLVSRVRDRCGNYVSYERDQAGLRAMVERSGRRIDVISERGLVREMVLRDAQSEEARRLVRYDYSEAGELVAAYDALGEPYTFSYEQRRLVQHTDRNGLSFYYAYAGLGQGARCFHAWGDHGLYDYHFEFDPVAHRVTIKDSLDGVSTIQLNEFNLPVSEINPLGGITKYEYDDRGRTTAVIDPGGNRTEYLYDERGNLLKLTRPDSTCIQTEFNADNKAIQITDPNGAVWQQQWDARGLLVEQTTPLGHRSRYEYNAQGHLVAFTNPRGARTALRFDDSGNLTVLTNALNHPTQFSYDLFGKVISKIDPLGCITSYEYDRKGRLLKATLPSGASVSCGYDPQDNLTRYVDEKGAETRLEYFGQGEIARRIQSDGHHVEYLYDTEERLIGVKNQRGETYQLKRDALGRIIEEVDYWGQPRKYKYSPAGHLCESTDPLGHRIRYKTDPLGRILKKTLPTGFIETFVYEGNGTLVESKNPHGVIKREFDMEGCLLKETQGDFIIENTYDANGNRITRKTSLGNNVSYEFDPLDQAVAVRINQGETIRIQRDAAGRIAHEKLSPQLSRHFSYSADGYLAEQAVSVNRSPLFSTSFEYDRAGNLTQRSDSRYGTDVYRYDPLGRITEHLDPQNRVTRYLNDPAGDRLRTRIVERTRQLAVGEDMVETEWSRVGEYDGTHYRFDRVGNLVERRDGQRDLHLVWDANQRLIESHSNGTITRYGYDPFGRRLFKETNGIRTKFFWDGDALVGEAVDVPKPPVELKPKIQSTDVQRTDRREQTQPVVKPKVREYVYYPETFEPLALVDGTSNVPPVYYYHNDPNGCPTRLTDTSGEVKWAVNYTAWGGVAKLAVNEVGNPIRLQGQYHDLETGLYYNNRRYFDSLICSFLSHDPLRLWAGENLYEFPPNIYKWIDPLGLTCRRIRDLIDQLRSGKDVEVRTIREARELLDNMPDLRPHTFDRRLPVPGVDDAGPAFRGDDWNQPGHSNPFWKQPNGTYRGDLINTAAPTGPVHPDLPAGHPHATTPHYNIRFQDGTKATILVKD